VASVRQCPLNGAGGSSLVGQGSIRRTFRAGNRRSNVAVDAHHATCISVYGIAVDVLLDPCFVCRRYRIRAAEQLLQPIAEHDGTKSKGVVIDKKAEPWEMPAAWASVRE
jgi:hypothetical protein